MHNTSTGDVICWMWWHQEWRVVLEAVPATSCCCSTDRPLFSSEAGGSASREAMLVVWVRQ
eukprot:11405044-Prorocentrum_lima.AAC.1